MTDHPTTSVTTIPQPDADQEARLSLSRQRMQTELEKVSAFHEMIYNAIVETNPGTAAILKKAHRALTNADNSAQAVSRAAAYYQQAARDALTVAGKLDDERTRIKAAIAGQDTLERLYGFGDMLTQIIEETESYAVEVEMDNIWRALSRAGVATQGELMDWLLNGDDTEYGSADYEAMAEQCMDLAEYFMKQAQQD
jgi:hypothetical protein